MRRSRRSALAAGCDAGLSGDLGGLLCVLCWFVVSGLVVLVRVVVLRRRGLSRGGSWGLARMAALLF